MTYDLIGKIIEKEFKCFSLKLNRYLNQQIEQFKINMKYRINATLMNSKLIPNFKIDFLKLQLSFSHLVETIKMKLEYF